MSEFIFEYREIGIFKGKVSWNNGGKFRSGLVTKEILVVYIKGCILKFLINYLFIIFQLKVLDLLSI